MSSGSWRIVSYNVHACIGNDSIFSPERIATVLATLHADFIALQEVEDRSVDGAPVSAFLSDRLGMLAYSGPTLQRGDAIYGNLLLAKPEAAAVSRHEISVPGREPRGVIGADFRLNRKLVRIFVTHLGLAGAERNKQVELLLPVVGQDEPDVRVLAADINEWLPAGRVHRQLASNFPAFTRMKTFPARLPLLALDRIYVTPSSTLQSSHVDQSKLAREASDHLPLVADIVI